jgi:glycosyltransferase involved in cell wall biosynthesis
MVADVSPLQIKGGGERVLWEHASRLVQRGSSVRILCRSDTGGGTGSLEVQGVHIRQFPVDRRSLFRFLQGSILEARRAFAHEVAREKPDVLHVHQPLSGYGVLPTPQGRRIPSLYTFHSPAPLEFRSRHRMTGQHRAGLIGLVGMGLLWTIERACLRLATRIHVLSDFSAGVLRKLYRIPPDRIVKIPGGADLERFQPCRDRDPLRQALGLPAGSPVLLTVRNLEARMGLDTLIRAMAILRRHVRDVVLLIGGEGSRRRELESLAGSLNLQTTVRFLGFIPEAELPRYYQAADTFVLPTRELEGFGLVTVEALACGTPVLGTPVGATPEILGPLDPSLLLHDRTPEAMAEDLRRFLEARARDEAMAQQLRQICRRHVEERYSWDISVHRLDMTLGALASAGSPEAAATRDSSRVAP